MRKSSPWRTYGLGLILLVLALGPFFRGLFFAFEIFVSIALTGLGFAAWVYGRRQDREPLGLPGGPAGWALLALVALYAVQFFWALYFHGNLEWLLRTVAGWFVFVMIRAENNASLRQRLGWIFVTSQSLLAFLGLLQFTGFFHNAPALAAFLRIPLQEGRLYTSYQYPNTTAAVFVAAILVGVGLLLGEEGKRQRLMLGAMVALIASAAFYTYSRGGLVVAPFAMVALLVGLRLRQALDTALTGLLVALVPIALLFQPFSSASQAKAWPTGLLLALGTAAVGAAGVLGVDYIRRLETRKLVIMIGTAAVVLSVAAIPLASRFVTRLSESNLLGQAERLTDISLETQNASERIQMYTDALEATTEQPWGYGGTGWERVYRKYQPWYYIARDTHSHLLQTLVETGFAGALAWVASLVIPAWLAFRRRFDDPMTWTFVTAGGAIAAHSLLDFDLSYLFVWILLYALLAAGQPQPTPQPHERKSRTWMLATAGGLLVALQAGMLAPAAYYYAKAGALIKADDHQGASKAILLAISFNPRDSNILRTTGEVKYLEKAVELDPHNPSNWVVLASALAKSGDMAGAQQAAAKAVELNPLRHQGYENLSAYMGARMEKALAEGDREAAVTQARELLNLQATLEKGIAETKAYKSFSRDPLKISPIIFMQVGKALYLTGDQDKALEYLRKATTGDQGVITSASLWMHAIYTKNKRTAEAKEVPTPPNASTIRQPLYQAILKWKP